MTPVELHVLRTPPPPGAWQSIGGSRQRVLAELGSLPDRQLVLVRYHPSHNPLAEWVYNDADIDNSKAVWARDMGPTQNEELLRYYNDRHTWLLDADEVPPRLTPYPCSTSGQLINAADRESSAEEYHCQ
jgi:hypothetical protein